MRLNAKTAKELRGAARYKNQSATPSKPTFPGVARFYSVPVYTTRVSFRTEYQRKDGMWVKVFIKGTSMNVIGRKGKQENIPFVAMVEHKHPDTITVRRFHDHALKWGDVEIPNPKAGKTYMAPKADMVPVTERVTVTGEKKTYRDLKRLNRMGALPSYSNAAGLDADVREFLREEAANREKVAA